MIKSEKVVANFVPGQLTHSDDFGLKFVLRLSAEYWAEPDGTGTIWIHWAHAADIFQ